jgi:microsomal dipeptidase-like Zn-dependent dipeptidase
MLIDGLQCGFFDRGVFEDLKAGGFSCVTPTLGFWEGAIESFDSVAKWRDLERANADLMTIVRKTDDSLAAERDGKVAMLLGYQNTNLLDGRIRYVELFADLGVKVLQLTYNNQNELGSSCYETVDPGLARFGREVVREMNQCGMLIDLSHVGDRTTLDTIEWSQKPVSITHANPASVFPHKRNKMVCPGGRREPQAQRRQPRNRRRRSSCGTAGWTCRCGKPRFALSMETERS